MSTTVDIPCLMSTTVDILCLMSTTVVVGPVASPCDRCDDHFQYYTLIAGDLTCSTERPVLVNT